MSLQKDVLDPVSLAIADLVVSDFLLAFDVLRDDGNGAALTPRPMDGVGIIDLVGQEVAGAVSLVPQEACRIGVGDIARRQVEGVRTAKDIREGVDLGRLTAAGRADRLIFRFFALLTAMGRAVRLDIGGVDGRRFRHRARRRQANPRHRHHPRRHLQGHRSQSHQCRPVKRKACS